MRGWKSRIFAPRSDMAAALKYASEASEVADRWRSSSDSSLRKNHVMSHLFDKLRVGSGGVAVATADPIDLAETVASHSLTSSPLEPTPPKSSPKSSPSPMKFTYSPGSIPLPRTTIRRGIGMGGFGEVYFAVTDAGKEVCAETDPAKPGDRAPRRLTLSESEASQPALALRRLSRRKR